MARKFIEPLVSGLVASLIAGFLVAKIPSMLDRSPNITYEISPVSIFKDVKLSVYEVFVSNTGEQPARNVQALIMFPDTVRIVDFSVSLKSEDFPITIESTPLQPNSKSILMEYLNPQSSCKLSFVVNSTKKESLDIRLRHDGKPIEMKDKYRSVTIIRFLFGAILAILAASIATFLFFSTRKRLAKK